MKKGKRYLVLLFMVVLLAGISIHASAAQSDDIKSVQECAHNYIEAPTIYTYYQIDSVKHKKITTPGKRCSNCGSIILGAQEITYEPHHFHESYTFENYHSGSQHFCKVKKQCACGYSTSYWKSYPCPGNGNCILPVSVEPVLADK